MLACFRILICLTVVLQQVLCEIESVRSDVCRHVQAIQTKMKCDSVYQPGTVANVCDMVHFVTENTTCETIAEEKEIDIQLLERNNIDCDNLPVNRTLCINHNFEEKLEYDDSSKEMNETSADADESTTEITETSNVEESTTETGSAEGDDEDDDDEEEALVTTTTKKPTTTTTATTTTTTAIKMNAVNKDGLMAHNYYRKKHGVSPLKYSASLAQYAQEWAEHLARKNTMQHRSQKTYGENLAMAQGKDIDGEDATDMWYDEIKNYNFQTGQRKWFSGEIGHFTQVVWAGSKEVGMGKARASNGAVYIVANYYPPGNFIGQYTRNVFPRQSK